MKLIKSFLIAALFLFVSFEAIGQSGTESRQTYSELGAVFDFGEVANSGQETVYLDLRSWEDVDSVVVTICVKNETDIDTVNFYPGVFSDESGFIADATALYNAVTLNVADAATDCEILRTATLTKLTDLVLGGYNGVKAVIEIAAAGNDATDPNAASISFRVYGRKR